MRLVKAAAVVLNQTPVDWEGNERNIRAALQQAREQGASVVCLPELCITGYGCEDAFQFIGVQEEAWAMLQRLLPETKGMIATVGLPLAHQNALYNTVAFIVDGEIRGFVPKQHLANDGIHYEQRWFKEWPEGVQSTVSLDGKSYPIGDLLFDIGGIRIGLETCEDAWVASRPGGKQAQRGADLILNSSASHFSFGKHEVRKRLVLDGSRAFNVSYVYSNLLGNEAGRAIYDGGALIASGGELLAQGPRLSFKDVHVTTATLDIDATRTNQRRTASFQPRIEAVDAGLLSAPFAWPFVEKEKRDPIRITAWEKSEFPKEEEFARAEALGLFDYLRKSKLDGFVLSLSGGADSAAVACLIKIMVDLARSEIGVAGIHKKLGHIPGIEKFQTSREFVNGLLTCAYQGGVNSSRETRHAARSVADNIGAQFHEFNIQPLVNAYEKIGAQVLGRPLDWKTEDMPRQNIQARTRSPGIWLVANMKNALLLTTSNRSESAVGYSTMDGDTSGGLAPLAGIDKDFLREKWLPWIEKKGSREFGYIPAVAEVFRKPPSGELRPLSENQTDEGDLMPHRILNAIQSALIRDKQTPVEIFKQLRPEFPELSPQKLGGHIEKLVNLFFKNQWKRDRTAPAFHLDDHNLDPKTGCRIPLVSGRFRKELKDMHVVVAEYERRENQVVLAQNATRPLMKSLESLAPEKPRQVTAGQ